VRPARPSNTWHLCVCGVVLQRVGPQACALFSFYLCGLNLAFAPQCFAFVHVSLAFGRKTSQVAAKGWDLGLYFLQRV
jgi:hypothetical protein